MSIPLLDRDSLKYPEYFWNELEKSNVQKKKDAPVAVILQAVACDDLSHTPNQSRILQIAKTHRVALKSIDAAHLVGSKIREIVQATGKQPKLLMIHAHGDAHLMHFGKKHWYDHWFSRSDYLESDVKIQDFSDLAPDAQIFLSSCKTGKSLAQKIANIAMQTVFAPTERMTCEHSCFVEEPNNKLKLLSYHARTGLQHVVEFKPNKSPEPFSDTIKSAKKRSIFSAMIDYTRHLASLGDADAQLTLGNWCMEGKIVKRSPKEAVRWFRLAADQGNKAAQYVIGICHHKGQEVDKSDKEAVRWFRLAAHQGHGPAQHMMGMAYFKGRGGLVKSDEEALKWFRLAAEQGDQWGQLCMGIFYSQGRGGLVKSPKEALKWTHRAAERDNEEAQYLMGLYYLAGPGKSDKEAMQWLRLAADQEYAPAQRVIGACYLHGRAGLVQSNLEAKKWLRLAADQGDIDAIYIIGSC